MCDDGPSAQMKASDHLEEPRGRVGSLSCRRRFGEFVVGARPLSEFRIHSAAEITAAGTGPSLKSESPAFGVGKQPLLDDLCDAHSHDPVEPTLFVSFNVFPFVGGGAASFSHLTGC